MAGYKNEPLRKRYPLATPSTYSLPFGAFVSKSLGIYLRNLLPFAALSALVLAPWIVLRILLRQDVPTPGGEAISSILQTVLSMVLTGALTYGVVQQMHGKSAGIGALVTAGMQSLGRVFVTSLVAGLIIGIGTLMLVVPGIIATVLLYVAIPVAVMEHKSVGDAMRRSSDLTRGSRWAIFGAALLMGLVSIGVVLLCTFVFATTSTASVAGIEYEAESLPLWMEIAIPLLLQPMNATLSSVCYVMLRQGKENVDVQQIAAVFD